MKRNNHRSKLRRPVWMDFKELGLHFFFKQYQSIVAIVTTHLKYANKYSVYNLHKDKFRCHGKSLFIIDVLTEQDFKVVLL